VKLFWAGGRDGEIGRRTGLKIPRWQHHVGSSPTPGTIWMVLMDTSNFSLNCIFCKIIAHEVPSEIITESDTIIVIQDIAPKASIHYLIIPKKHIKDLASLEYHDGYFGSEMLFMAKKLSHDIPQAADFKFLINNGYAAGQRVFHLHAHFLAGHTFGEFGLAV
jgi:histidine triad (HIT) family protein